jgi:hypothetical protein
LLYQAEADFVGFASSAKAFDESLVDIDEDWKYYHMDIVSGHTSERLVVFRARPPSKRLGCVRVSKDQDLKEMIWDRYNCEGIYIGHVPAGCPFEAMVVEIKLITTR